MQAVVRLLSNAPEYGAIAVKGMSKMLAKYYLPKRRVPRDKGENKPTALNKLLSIPLKASTETRKFRTCCWTLIVCGFGSDQNAHFSFIWSFASTVRQRRRDLHVMHRGTDIHS